MSTDATRTSLVNLALREIGTTRIEDWTEASPEAQVARDVWDQAVRMCLARRGWRFAMTARALARAATTPATRYDYLYTLPGDLVRLEAVADNDTMEPPLTAYHLMEDGIATSAAAVYVEYVYEAPAIGTWPAWFTQVLVCDLASLMASPLKSTTERERLEQLAESRLRTAKAIDEQQRGVRTWREGSWVMAARGLRRR